MAGPGDEIAGGEAGRLRASHADRNRVIDVLKAAFTQGMLDKDEFDLRVGQVLTSRTYADLAALTADIPATLAAQPPPVPARQSRERSFVKALACALVVVPTTMVGLVLIAGHHLAPAAIILNVVLFACMVGVPATLLVMVHSWLDNRESRPASPGSPPSVPGTAGWRLAPADPEGQPAQISPDPPGTALSSSRPPYRRIHLGHRYAIG
jgi:hypothetical protein